MLLEKYVKARDAKKSILCVGLDPTVKELKAKDSVPEKYFQSKDAGDGLLEFCLHIIEETGEHACAFKPNAQYVSIPMGLERMKKLNRRIHDSGAFSIMDLKLGDIGSTNQSGLYWIKEAGFDALTFSPYAGNIAECVKSARDFGLGVFVLTLMSNPESQWVQKEALFKGKPLYMKVAEEIRDSKADGAVIGATGHVTPEDIFTVRRIVGEDTVFLCPGVGAQGGDVEKLLKAGGRNLLINVSRGVIFAENPRKAAEEYRRSFSLG